MQLRHRARTRCRKSACSPGSCCCSSSTSTHRDIYVQCRNYLCDSGHGNVQRQQTRNKRLPTSHKAVMFQCCPHLTLCRSASTPDSSSTSLHRACSRVSPSSRKPARVEYLQSQHTINTWTSMDVTGPACSRVSPSSSKPARVEYLHRHTPLNLWGTSVCPAQGSPQGWESCTTHTHSHHGQQLAHDPCKEACKGGGTAPNLKHRVLPHADMLALGYVCWA